MTPQSPAALRPLVLLTLAVLVAHLVLLDSAPRYQPAAAPQLRSLVTRVLTIAPPAHGDAALRPEPVEQNKPGRALPTNPRQATQPVIVATGGPDIDASPTHAAAMPRPVDSLPEAAPANRSESAAAVGPTVQPTSTNDATPPTAPSSITPQAAAAPGLALAIPGSVRLRYAVSGHSRGQAWSVDGELLWRHDGSQYEASLQYSAPLLRSRLQRSTGRLTAEGLAPQRFSDQRRGEQATHFERETGRLVFSNNAPPQPLAPGMQDRLSVFLQLAAMVAAAPARFPSGSEITLPTAGTRDAQASLFKVQGDEILALPGGLVETRKLVRDPLGEYEPRVEIWLGTGMDYMPVRIRLTQPNGDYVDQQWSSTDRP